MTRAVKKAMPLGRYFIFVGGILLTLMFLADRYVPKQIVASARADIDRSIIRVHTRHRWPEAVVYDTSLPTIVPSAVVADVAPERSPREAFAQLPQAPAPVRSQITETLPKAVAARRAAKPRPPVRRVANYQPFEGGGIFAVGW